MVRTKLLTKKNNTITFGNLNKIQIENKKTK